MRLLVLGGTRFLGRHLTDAALARGHEVTLFNRGVTNPSLYPEVERLEGDRNGDLSALRGRRWDVVIDTCGFVPRIVKVSADLLSGTVGHYTFISTVSVYADPSQMGLKENAPLGRLEDENVEEITGETYGPLKALCEQAVQGAFPRDALVIRPGLIVGPFDPTDRFTYWPVRIAQGGEVLVPDNPDGPLQIIDGRDLAAWTLDMVEVRQAGVFNTVGPDYCLTRKLFLETCMQVSGNDASLTWVDEEFLLAQGVAPWTELPMWLPGEEFEGYETVDASKAIAAGLTFRPLEETVRDTLAWNATRPPEAERRAGMDPMRESELLMAWRERG
jgi:2'-hydroxyisoflavone reductase